MIEKKINLLKKTLNWTNLKKMYDKNKITNSVFHNEISHVFDCNKLRAYNM